MRHFILTLFLIPLALVFGDEVNSSEIKNKSQIRCGNLIYAGTRSSVCFANKFLTRINAETQIEVARSFKDVKLATDNVFETPFCVFSGEGKFSLSKDERSNLKKYLQNGGFILASPNCSNKEWDSSFRQLIKSLFPDSRQS